MKLFVTFIIIILVFDLNAQGDMPMEIQINQTQNNDQIINSTQNNASNIVEENAQKSISETSNQTVQQIVKEQSKQNGQNNQNQWDNVDQQKMLEEEAMRVQIQKKKKMGLDVQIVLSEEQKKEAERLQIQNQIAARQAYEKVKFQEQQRLKKQKQQMQRLKVDGQIQKTQSIKLAEAESARYVLQSIQKMQYNEYLFELQSMIEDFNFHFSHAEKIYFYILAYVAIGNTYTIAQNTNENPIRLYIYENNTKLIRQQQFYFNIGVQFIGEENTNYLLKFVNTSSIRLISMWSSIITQKPLISKALTANDVISYAPRTKELRRSIDSHMQSYKTLSTFSNEINQKISSQIEIYYIYSLVQTAFTVIVCLFQIQVFRKLLSKSSIV